MSFDALTLAAVRDELQNLVGARMQKIVFEDDLSLAVEFFAPSIGRTNVLLSAHLEHGRVQRIRQLPARGVERDSPFSLQVRKHLRNARVRSVHQPPLERVLQLECEQRDSTDQLYKVTLIVEAMGRRSNLVLVGADGLILDAARRTPPSRNARRPILPHLPYAPPPPQTRLMPSDISAESLGEGAPAPLAKRLGERVAGLSPLAARELAFRACGSVDAVDVDWRHVADVLHEFFGVVDRHDWSPTVAADADGLPLKYAPYVLTHLAASGPLQSFESISEAMDVYYAAETARAPRRGDALAGERKTLLAQLERSRHTAQRRVAAMEHQLATGTSDREPMRQAGELLLTYQADVPADSEEVVLDGTHIQLDPHLSAVENAQAYFARYRKARDTEARVPELLDEARQTLAHLEELRTLVEVADQMDAIRALRREVGAATGASGRADSRGVSRSTPYRRVALDGFEAFVGTSSLGNATVTFDLARPDDLWLHARGVPGAHVILRSGAPESAVEAAAQLAAAHSANRTAGAVEVDVTQRRYVKKIPGAPPGLVRYANERTLRVAPRSRQDTS